MAKKKRSAKQLANDKRLGLMAKRRGRKTVKRIKRRVSKTIKRVKRRTSVVKRRRSSPRKSRSIASKIPLVNNPTVRKVATGIGLATIGTAVIGLVAPQFASNPIIKPALAFLGGGVAGVIGQVVVGGGIGGLTSLIGGGSNSNGNTNTAGNGFA